MNINNNSPVATNFKGISPEVMKNLSSMPRELRRTIANHLPTLEKSDVVDLVMLGDKLGIKTKKAITKSAAFVDGSINGNIPEGTEFTFENIEALKLRENRIDFNNITVNGKNDNLSLRFYYRNIAEQLFELINGEETYLCECAPKLGVILDTMHKIAEPLTNVRKSIVQIEE